jgi:protein-S-isoprenylcysteine O-methyltransferase Ste14
VSDLEKAEAADMHDTTSANSGEQPSERLDRRRLIVSTILTLLVFLMCLFVPAGSLSWFKGWLFFVVIVGTMTLVAIHLQRVNPEVIAGRVNRHKGTKTWDRFLVAAMLPLLVSTIPLAALDDGRFHWSHVPWWACALGYALVILGTIGLTWAESVNKFFEPTVRIQTDRGHHVIDVGPYAIVRHPGYVSAFMFFTGIPLSLGSLWALIPAILCCLLLVLRTILEDRTLRAELAGYQEYTQRVRCRLIPGIW